MSLKSSFVQHYLKFMVKGTKQERA